MLYNGVVKSHLFTIFKFLFGWPLSLFAFYFILKLISPEWGSIKEQITHVNLSLLVLAIFCFLAYYFLRCFLWQIILQAYSYSLLFKETAFLWGMSEVNRYIPGNIWSLLGRTMLFHKKEVAKKDIAAALLVEAQFVLIGAVVVSLVSVGFIFDKIFPFLWFSDFLQTIIYIAIFCIALLYVFQSEILAFLGKTPKGYLQHLLPGFGSGVQIRLFLISLLAFFFFGLGYYFAISSVFLLHPQLVFVYAGFFVFSLLVGYLSFITPAGLGVREGVVLFGLLSTMSASLAGLAAIFSRVVLVAAEIIFIALTFLWITIRNRLILRLEQYLIIHKYEAFLFLLFLIFCAYFTVASFSRYDNFYTGRFDLGNMAQTVWNTMNGRIFAITDPDGTEIVSRLAFHADFVLIFLAPFYMLWTNPKMLLLIQVIVVGIGGIFVYFISQKLLGNKALSLVFAFLYFLNPSVQRATLYDFHAVVLATTFILAAYYFILNKRYMWFIVFAFLAALTKEQVWFVVGLFGIYLAIKHKQWLFGSVFFLMCTSMFYYFIWFAIPSANGSSHFALSYYDDAGDSPTALIKNVLLSPGKTIAKLTSEDRVDYFKKLLLPLGYTPLAAPAYLIFAAPDLFINTMSDRPHLHQIYYQYTAVITPFLFLGAIYGVSSIRKRFPEMPAAFFAVTLFISGLYSQYAYGPLPGSRESNLDMFTKHVTNRETIHYALSQIPPELSVAASNNLGANLSHRERLYTIPIGILQADVVAFLLNDKGAQPSPEMQKEMVDMLRANPRYELIISDNDFFLFQKKVSQ